MRAALALDGAPAYEAARRGFGRARARYRRAADARDAAARAPPEAAARDRRARADARAAVADAAGRARSLRALEALLAPPAFADRPLGDTLDRIAAGAKNPFIEDRRRDLLFSDRLRERRATLDNGVAPSADAADRFGPAFPDLEALLARRGPRRRSNS